MLEYFIVIYEYYKTTRKTFIWFNFIVSIIFGILVFLVSKRVEFIEHANKLIESVISVLGVLVGFAISMFTLLNTASNPNIESIKKKETGAKLYNKPIYLFDLLIVSMVYIIIVESFLLIFNLLYPFFFKPNTLCGLILFCINISILIHIIIVNISTTVNFYFIITPKNKK